MTWIENLRVWLLRAAESVKPTAQDENPPQEALIDELTDADFWAEGLAGTLSWFETQVLTRDTLLELGLVVLAAALAWPIAAFLRGWFDKQSQKESRYAALSRVWVTAAEVAFPLVWMALQWIVIGVTDAVGVRNSLLTVTTSLLLAWVVVNLATTFVANAFWSRLISVTAWSIAAMNILGILDDAQVILDDLRVTLGQVSVSALTIIQGLIALGILLWFTSLLGTVVEGRLRNSPNLTPSIQVLSAKLIRIGLGTFAFLAALTIVGVDLTALAVFGGAIGVGLGFGLQKIFANLVSGFILLLDKSIKPGDTIAVPDYYGRVDHLGARYVSVTTRDGIEHLIPNEELITTRVENWSHSQDLLRLRKVVGIHYKSDVRKARALCLEAAAETDRILADPKPVCLVKDFGESSVDLEMRFWINDPMNGRANVTSDMLQRIWDKFHEHDIEIPYPQRDLHLRSSDIGKLEAS